MTLDTVDIEVPAAFATSFIVTAKAPYPLSMETAKPYGPILPPARPSDQSISPAGAKFSALSE